MTTLSRLDPLLLIPAGVLAFLACCAPVLLGLV